MIYFDNAATTMIHPVVREKLMPEINEYFANPSSLHHEGLKVRRRIEEIRSAVAKLAKAKPSEVLFTSGGTEANNLCLQGVLQPGDHLITTAIEHSSVRSVAKELGIEVSLATDITLEGILKLIQPNTKLVSVMLVNNETGHRFPLAGLHQDLKQRGILLHRDGVQALGKFDLSSEYDLLSFSAHKIGGLKGTGGLIIKGKPNLSPLLIGGDQERSLRPGTENVPGILALGLVLDEESSRLTERLEHVQTLKTSFIDQLEESITVLSPGDASPYVVSFSAPGIPSEIILNAMSVKGMYFSAGSACSARSPLKSHVIAWLTEDEAIRNGAFRVSFSWQNTQEEVTAFVKALIQTISQLRKVIR